MGARKRGSACTFDGGDEKSRSTDAVNVTRIIAEEDSSEGGKCAHQVGLPGDWGLDVNNVIGSGELDVLFG